jgi:hypothetical protein
MSVDEPGAAKQKHRGKAKTRMTLGGILRQTGKSLPVSDIQ